MESYFQRLLINIINFIFFFSWILNFSWDSKLGRVVSIFVFIYYFWRASFSTKGYIRSSKIFFDTCYIILLRLYYPCHNSYWRQDHSVLSCFRHRETKVLIILNLQDFVLLVRVRNRKGIWPSRQCTDIWHENQG